jgi:aminoglycoside 2'-N-acetyltransferase I
VDVGRTQALSLSIEILESPSMPPLAIEEVRDLCTEAYGEDFSELLTLLGPGVHVLGRIDGILVCHAMWVTRWLQPEGRKPLRTAYVEAVATKPQFQRQGFATKILARLAEEIRDYDLGALSPSDQGFYARLGWEPWRGPLFIRANMQLHATPDESVMILHLPCTPADLDPTESLSAEWRPGELW